MLLTLTKVQLRAAFSGFARNLRSKSPAARAFMILALVYCFGVMAFLLGGLFYSLAGPLHEAGLDSLYFAVSGLLSMGFCGFLDLFMVKSRIYEATDNELLLAMPIRPRVILASRLFSVIAYNWLYCLITAFIPVVMYQWVLGFDFGLTLRFLPAFLLLPLIPTVLGLCLGWLLTRIERLIKRKNIVTTVLSLGFLALYISLVNRMEDAVTALTTQGAALGAKLSYVLPVWFYGAGLAGDLPSYLGYLVLALAVFIAAALLLSRSFAGLALDRTAARRKERAVKGWPQHDLRVSLILKELQRFVSSSAYMLNSGIGLVFLPVVPILLLVQEHGLTEILGILPPSLPTAVPAVLVLALLTGTVMISAPSVSLEGKNLWLLHSLPIPEGELLLAKSRTHTLLTLPFGLAASVISIVALRISPLFWPLMLLTPPIYALFHGLWGVFLNLHFYNFAWTSEIQPIKQGISVLLAMLSGMVMALLPALLYLLMREFVSAALFAHLWLLLILGLALLLRRWMLSRGARIFATLN